MNWRVVMAADELWIGELVGVELGPTKIILLNVEGEIRAYEDRCPHLGNRLSDGDLAAGKLTCATHRWEFDALTGKGANPKNCQLKVFDARIRAGQIEVRARDHPTNGAFVA
jgi:toluene monooxygenase system ferredoxin subunit